MFHRALRCMLLALVGAWGVLAAGGVQAADFQFGFTAEATSPLSQYTINCNRAGADSRCFIGGRVYTDPTPFLQEVIMVDGIRYFHSIVGDPNSGFAQEVYINASSCCYPNTFPRSASGGNGTGNPTRMAMRNMISDDEITQWFIKDDLEFKPLITQSIANTEVLMDFAVDMANINYSTIDVTGTVSNKLQLLEGFRDAGDYDSTVIPSFFSDKSTVIQYVNAGRYTYTPGSGEGGSGGTYTYWDGVYDEYLADHNLFRRDDQNVGNQVLP